MTIITTPVRLSQAVYSQRALWNRRSFDAFLENLGLDNPFRRGTPARKHASTDRAARKEEARRRARDGEVVAAFAKPGHHPHQRRPTAEQTAAWERGNSSDIIAVNYAEVEARVLAARAPSELQHIVVEREGAWWVAIAVHDEIDLSAARGPYAAKKTANRVARTLNGG